MMIQDMCLVFSSHNWFFYPGFILFVLGHGVHAILKSLVIILLANKGLDYSFLLLLYFFFLGSEE